ncbi:MAG: FimB/Mfa2 family fimbrial subunit [Muribaculaceae bacterium]|nr:FimB/Mfa2 family fimbrial subunit [Muribaculaceae bacterium]
MGINNTGKIIAGGASLLMLLLSGSCSMVTDDPVACPARLSVRFVYDYNIKFADAFQHEVKSVNVWAFGSDGSLAWSGSASGDALAESDFKIDTPLDEGSYEFVAWCGLEGNEDFELATYTPASREELEMALRTLPGDVSRSHLAGLYHGYTGVVDYEVDPYRPSFKTVSIPLMKDTKDIRVMLQHLDGSEIDNRDFTCTITTADAGLGWDNALLPSPMVTYSPWEVRYGVTTAPGTTERPDEADGSRTITTVASLLFDMSTSRLSTSRPATLTIHRNWDDRDIIRINLIDYLLLVKGHYGEMGDQEYLDRQDDYSIVFFIDKNSNWNVAGGIFINNWAVVPPQENPL